MPHGRPFERCPVDVIDQGDATPTPVSPAACFSRIVTNIPESPPRVRLLHPLPSSPAHSSYCSLLYPPVLPVFIVTAKYNHSLCCYLSPLRTANPFALLSHDFIDETVISLISDEIGTIPPFWVLTILTLHHSAFIPSPPSPRTRAKHVLLPTLQLSRHIRLMSSGILLLMALT